MADHARKQIRDAIKALIKGLPCCEDRVEIGRPRPWTIDQLTGFQPLSIRIYTPQDAASNFSENFPATQLRKLILRIEGTTLTSEAPDDDLDAAALQIEKKLAEDPTLGRKLKSLSPPLTTIAVEAKGDKQDGGFRIEYSATYSVKQNAPDVLK